MGTLLPTEQKQKIEIKEERGEEIQSEFSFPFLILGPPDWLENCAGAGWLDPQEKEIELFADSLRNLEVELWVLSANVGPFALVKPGLHQVPHLLELPCLQACSS